MAAGVPAAELADLPTPVTLGETHVLADSFRPYQRFTFTLPDLEGAPSCERDILRVGQVVAVLPLDPVRDEIVVLRQFRLAAHLANGAGNLIEIVAGHVEKGEIPLEAARREALEEIGLKPSALIEVLRFLPSPGVLEEEITLYLGVVDAATVPARAGLQTEHEITQPMAIPIDAALAALESGKLRNGPLIIALQWLALHRSRLAGIIAGG